MAKILLVEDNVDCSMMLTEMLSAERHVVENVDTATEALARLGLYDYDAIILDWELPDAKGIQVCRQYRQRGGSLPILMLTGKSTIEDKETGFACGADDYLTKPFEGPELRARIRSLLRRVCENATQKIQVRHITYRCGSSVLCAGKEVALMPSESSLLELFLRNPNEVFTYEALLECSGSSAETVKGIRKCVERLRKKLDLPDTPSLISTVHHVGYVLKNSGEDD